MPDRLSDLPLRDLLDRLATSAPVPGGGSTAALSGAAGAGLLEMVVALTEGRPAAAEHEGTLAAIRTRAAELRSDLTDLVDIDADAYDAVVAARRLPRDTRAEAAARAELMAQATRAATIAPLRTARAASEVLTLATALAPIGNRNAVSDVGVAGLLGGAAVRAAGLNVSINLPALADDDPLRIEAARELDSLLVDLAAREEDLRRAVAGRIG